MDPGTSSRRPSRQSQQLRRQSQQEPQQQQQQRRPRKKSSSPSNRSITPSRIPRRAESQPSSSRQRRPSQQQQQQPQSSRRNTFVFSDDESATEQEEEDDDDSDEEGSDAQETPQTRHRQQQRRPTTATSTNNNNTTTTTKQRSMSRSGPDTLDLTRQIERLQRDLARRDQELHEERNETERGLVRIRKLERDKTELEQELEEVREELNEYVIKFDELRQLQEQTPAKKQGQRQKETGGQRVTIMSESEETEQRNVELNKVIEQKNHEIEKLFEDLEQLESDKHSLLCKLTDLRDSLQDATTQIEAMSSESDQLKSALEKSENQIKKLEEEKTILEIKERDLLTFKERHEKYLENLCTAVDVRVDVWKRMLIEKDEEIDRLNIKIAALVAQIPNTQIDNDKSAIRLLKKKILDREEQINLLNQQLSQATIDIETHTKTIQDLQTKLNYTENNDTTQKFVASLQGKLKKYAAAFEQKSTVVHSYEKEIEERSREVTQLLSRLHDYETGQYGLVDAIGEIKQVKGSLRVRDKQIEALTQELNQLQLQKQDVVDENELLRSKLGLKDSSHLKSLKIETQEYVQSRQGEIDRLKSRIRSLENDIIQLKSKNYSLRKEMNSVLKSTIHGQEEQDEVEEKGQESNTKTTKPSPLSPPSALPTMVGRKRNVKERTTTTTQASSSKDDQRIPSMVMMSQQQQQQTQWKEKYEIILNENTELRKGLVEILDSMRRLSDEKTSNILIESPILENLLREMSARGLINYPHPISGFHLKVCNLEGKNSQLREEIHRLRYEEKQLRIELLETKVHLQAAQDKLKSPYRQISPARPRSKSRDSILEIPGTEPKRNVAFSKDSTTTSNQDDIEQIEPFEELRNKFHIEAPKDIINQELSSEIQALRDENNNLKQSHTMEKSHLESQLESLVQKGNEIIQLSSDGKTSSSQEIILQRKFQFLQFLNSICKNENSRLLGRVAEIENEFISKISFLERFRVRALSQIGIFQSVLESSVPISSLVATKKELEMMRKEWEALQVKNDTLTINCMNLEKSVLEIGELRRANEKYKKELQESKLEINSLKTTSTPSAMAQEGESADQVSPKILKLEAEVQQLNEKLKTTGQEIINLQSSNSQLEKSKEELQAKSNKLVAQIQSLVSQEKQYKLELSTTVKQEDYEALQSKLIALQQTMSNTKDELMKWKDLVELGQNQIYAMENIKNFEKMEIESLISQVCDLQATELDKVELARVKREMVCAEKEKVLAEQQVQKLQAKISQLEVLQLQAEKSASDREMSLLAMHTQVINRYRNLFTVLYENHSDRNACNNWISSEQLHEAWELFNKCKVQIEELESELIQTQQASDSYEEKCHALEEMLNVMRRDGQNNAENNNGNNFELLSRLQEAKLDIARWKRKAEHGERKISSLVENLQRLETKTASMEEERIRTEHSLDLKESLSQLISISTPTPTKKRIPPAASASTSASSDIPLVPVTSQSQLVQTEESLSDVYNAQLQINQLQNQINQLETLLNAKDQVLSEFKVLHIEPYKSTTTPQSRVMSPRAYPEFSEALQVAQDSIKNLQDRLKIKEDNITQYRKLLAELRHEMTISGDRHVQEMKALQLTIYQQQQAFTRMKSTLSQPVKDSINIEGATLRDQLTRINELEDEVSELQHALGNVASQLTSARSDATKWRQLADTRLKELDASRDHLAEASLEEVKLLREKLRHQEELLRDFRIVGPSTSSLQLSNEEIRKESEIIQVLRAELTDKETKLNTYANTIQSLKKGGPKSIEKQQDEMSQKDVRELKETNRQLQQKVNVLTLKISKINASNQASGVSTELETLRSKLKEIQAEKLNLQKKLDEFQMKAHDDEEKRRKQIDSLARWDESKKWKKIVEKYESRIQELELESEKLTKTNQSLRLIVTRLEKDKHLSDSKLLHQAKITKSKESTIHGGDETTPTMTTTTDSEQQHKQAQASSSTVATATASASATIDQLRLESFELKESLEKSQIQSHQEIEKLKMEIRVLKERITSQERQIVAYQVASKGDPKIIAEIEKMVKNEENLQKELLRLEEENLHLNLQMEQLKMDTPRLRDRVQHLQKLVDVLKIEKPLQQTSTQISGSRSNLARPSSSSIVSTRSKSTTNQKSLCELESTIAALKTVIDKLQNENKRLKKPSNIGQQQTRSKIGTNGVTGRSAENLKTSIASLLEEKQLLLDQLHQLEHEKQKYHQMYLDATSTIDHLQINLVDTEKKAKSAEMKLKSFLNTRSTSADEASGQVDFGTSEGILEPSGNEKMFVYMRNLQEQLERKDKLLAEAKEALKQAKDVAVVGEKQHSRQNK